MVLEMKVIEVTVDTGNGGKVVSLSHGTTVLELLRKLDLYPDANIVLLKGVPTPITEILQEDDSVRIVRIASGG